MFGKTIAIGLAPNNNLNDVVLALKKILWIFDWKNGSSIKKLENEFKEFVGLRFSFSFNSGRSALLVGLNALNLPPGSQVAVQAFTCVVVPNAIRFAGLKPLYIDIKSDGFGMDPEDLKKKISSNTKAIILQNLFGIPDDLETVKRIARENKLILIEDSAQALGAVYRDRKIGSFGAFSFFSMGRDKVISSTFGGVLLTNNKKIATQVHKIYSCLEFPDFFWIFRQLLHPIVFFFITPSYSWLKIGKFSIGKALLFAMQKSGLLDFPVKKKEKLGRQISDYPKKLPNALAALSLNQFIKLDKFNQKRKIIAQYYLNKLNNIKSIHFPYIGNECQPIFLRMPVTAVNAKELRLFAKQRNILLGNWYSSVVDPAGTNLKCAGYISGSCPDAERRSKMTINLPTYPKMTVKDAQKVVSCVKHFYQNE